MLEIKNTVSEIKTAFDGLINRLGTAEERITELRLSQEKPPKLKSEENKD